MPRFVILLHQTPLEEERSSHWDLMFQWGERLITWAVDDEPRVGLRQSCRKLADHRAAYLVYEGPISGGRGVVRRWDWGEFTLEENSDDEIRVRLSGRRLDVQLTFTRGDDDQNWSLRID